MIGATVMDTIAHCYRSDDSDDDNDVGNGGSVGANSTNGNGNGTAVDGGDICIGNGCGNDCDCSDCCDTVVDDDDASLVAAAVDDVSISVTGTATVDGGAGVFRLRPGLAGGVGPPLSYDTT